MKKLKEPPLAIGGLGLSFFSLGNILGDYSIILRYVLGAIAFGLYFLLLIAVFRSFKTYLNILRDPLTASIFPTLLMQGMLMISYCDDFPDLYGITELIFRTIWWLSFILLIIYIIIFSKRFLWNFKLNNVYPSWAVLYIGIGISSVTVPWTGYSYLGKIIFAYILFAVIVLLPIVFLRLYKHGIADEVRANIATLCAPALVVVAYQNSFEPVNQSLLLVLVILSQILYVIVLYQIPKILKNGFNPGFSAMTFPLIVSATALKGCARYFGNDHWLNGLFTLELIIATLILARVAAGYVNFFRN
ncbi:exfoliative toxin A/B [Streptococcus equinus]|uniref:Exfoliative toxin A/B n=1 Tax=Streptococcus equinus TaxID=1335 RepID=A0A1H0KW55_STREI|nr:TDT family transporter [Streptococcus equinus]SDO60169.1 exfoliative toxin A/B [Streptococcus equinus]